MSFSYIKGLLYSVVDYESNPVIEAMFNVCHAISVVLNSSTSINEPSWNLLDISQRIFHSLLKGYFTDNIEVSYWLS